jgi:hypothetical protein
MNAPDEVETLWTCSSGAGRSAIMIKADSADPDAVKDAVAVQSSDCDVLDFAAAEVRRASFRHSVLKPLPALGRHLLHLVFCVIASSLCPDVADAVTR